jgi:hypothetical protein
MTLQLFLIFIGFSPKKIILDQISLATVCIWKK